MATKLQTIILILLSIVSTAKVEATGLNLTAKQLSASDGLVSNTIRAIVQDNDGYIWMGGIAGLSRYDGYSFVRFDDQKHSCNFVGILRYDSKNNLMWVISATAEVKCLDLNKYTFVDLCKDNDSRTYRKHHLAGSGMWLYSDQYGIRHVGVKNGKLVTTDYNRQNKLLPENNVMYLTSDGKDNIWAITTRHIIRISPEGKIEIKAKNVLPIDLRAMGDDIVVLDKSNYLWHYYANGKLKHHSKLPLPLGNINNVTTSMIWQHAYYAFTNSLTYAYDIKRGNWYKPTNIQIPSGFDQGQTSGYKFVANNSDGNLWIFPDKGKEICLSITTHISANPGRKHIYNVAAMSDSTLAIATFGDGLTLYNTKSGRTRKYSADDDKPLFHTNFLFDIMKDRSGSLWVAADGAGVSKLEVSEPQIAKYAIPLTDKHGSRDNGIKRILRINDGSIVVSTYNNKNYYLNSKTATLAPCDRFADDLSAYCTDRYGQEWIGSTSQGLTLNGKKYIADNSISDIAADKHGRIWIATWQKGLLWTMAQKGGEPKFNATLQDNYNSRRINDIELSPSGWLFVATYNGLYVINTNSKKITSADVVCLNSETQGLATNLITTVCATADGTLWIGTSGAGLLKAKFNATAKKLEYQTITHRNGLPNNNVVAIGIGEGNTVWIGTDDGLAIVDANNLWAKKMNVSADIMANIFNTACVLSLGDGEILFGTNEGVAIVNSKLYLTPKELAKKPVIANMLINGTSIFNNYSDYNSSILAGAIEVAHSQGNLTFTFSTLDYTHIDETLYSYYIEGIDKTWREPTRQNSCEYTNLMPGSYTLHVKASIGNGWSEETIVGIVVRQPWYNTWLAWIAYIALLAIIGYTVYSQWKRNFELKQRMKVEKEITEFRIGFFTNIAHEFRTPLAIIDGAVNKIEAIHNGKQTGSQRASIQMVKRGTQRLLRLVNELMEFRKINTGNARLEVGQCDIIEIIRNVYCDFRPLAEQKLQNMTFVPFDKSFMGTFDKNKIETIAYNLISNAIKYTPTKGSIDIRIKHSADRIVVSVSDSGPGISQKQQESLFEPFMHGYVSKGGMGIGLYTAHRMATIHHGELKYEKNDEGSTFTLTLPDNDSPYSANEYSQREDDLQLEQHEDDRAKEIISELHPEALNEETIAIIEDDADMMAQLKYELGTYFNTVCFVNGKEGYKGVIETKPALVVCDVMLPDMDGYSIVSKLKKAASMENTPVIMLTALDDVNHQLRGYKAGADDYMVKPCNYQLLIARTIQLITWAKARETKYGNKQQAGDTETTAPTKIVTSMADKNFKQDVDFHISQHISDPDFNVDQLAALLQMGHTKFYGKMKELTGMSPNKYIMGERMRIAAELVLEGRMNISEIAYRVGFQDPSYFNKCFKKQFGEVPSRYGK